MSLFNLVEHSGLADANFGGKAGKAAHDGWKSHARIQRLLEEPNATVAEFAAHIRAGNRGSDDESLLCPVGFC